MKSWLFRFVISLAISLGELLCLSFKPPSISLFTDYIRMHTETHTHTHSNLHTTQIYMYIYINPKIKLLRQFLYRLLSCPFPSRFLMSGLLSRHSLSISLVLSFLFTQLFLLHSIFWPSFLFAYFGEFLTSNEIACVNL